MYGIIIIISYFLEQPFRIQDSYARPQAIIQSINKSINQDYQTFISI